MSNVIDAAMIFAVPALIGGSLAYLKMGVMALRERKKLLEAEILAEIRVIESENVVRGDGVIHIPLSSTHV